MTKTINISESAYHALKAQKCARKIYSDVILRVAGGEEKSVCDFLLAMNPNVRSEIA